MYFYYIQQNNQNSFLKFLNRNRLVNNYWLATNTDGWFMCTQ